MYNTHPLLISIDGPDGTGKSTLAEILFEKLQEILGKDKVILAKPTYFETSPRAMKIKEEFKRMEGKISKDSREHNRFYLKALEMNYEDVVRPNLQAGKIVLLDSSEIRSLAFIFCNGSQDAISDTIEKIKDDSLTKGLFPKIRIFLSGEDQDIWKNLLSKRKLDSGDPQDIKGVEKIKAAYSEAIKVINRTIGLLSSEWLIISVKHTKLDPQSYLLSLVNEKILIKLFEKQILNIEHSPTSKSGNSV